MTSRLLLDTNIVIRWVAGPDRLSREQLRALEGAVRRQESVAVSAITLLEMALLLRGGDRAISTQIHQTLDEIESNPAFEVLPLTFEIARDVTPLVGLLRDPSDCVIVATARVHGLRLLTLDQRILDSNLVQVID